MATTTTATASTSAPNMKTNLDRVESFMNASAYRDLVESANNYNTRLCIERRMRLPFLDSQTGVAQNHSALFMHKRQRMPGTVPGQIYTYPRQRWRKRRRQYLLMNSRSFARAVDAQHHHLEQGDGDMHSISAVENPALQDTDSKDSQLLLKDEVSKEWFYDEQDMLEIDDYDVPDQDSDLDYEESYSKRSRRRKGSGRGRGANSDSPSAPGRRRGSGRGRRKANANPSTIHHFENVNGDGDNKPFACERTPGRRGRQPQNNTNSGSTPGSSGSSSTSTMHSSPAPPTLPPNPPPSSSTSSSTLDDPPMPVLVPESIDSIPSSAPSSTSAPSLSSTVPTGGPTTATAPPSTPPAPLPAAATSATTTDPAAAPAVSSLSADDAPALVPSAAATALANKERAPPSPYCDFCLGDSRENKKTGGSEELVSCSDCGRSGHPTCLQFTNNMMVSVKKYRWQCIECKCCSICGTSDNDDQLLFCDDCDRGYHMYCLNPALPTPPEGSWSCKLCINEFHKK